MSNVFGFEKVKNFYLVFKWYVEKDLSLKASFLGIKYFLTSAENNDNCKILYPVKVFVKSSLLKGFEWLFMVSLSFIDHKTQP